MTQPSSKLKFLLPILVFLTFAISAVPAIGQTVVRPAESRFYYYLGETVSLEIAPEVVAVRFRDEDANQQITTIQQFSAVLQMAESTPYASQNFTLLHLEGAISREGVDNAMSRLRQEGQVAWANPVFQVPAGYAVLTDEFITQFPASWGEAQIQQFNAERHVEIVSELLSDDNSYLLRMTQIALVDGSLITDALEMANAYQESGQVIYAEPNLVTIFNDRVPVTSEDISRSFVPNDTFFANQWALNNTGQTVNGVAAGTPDADIDAVEAWNITRGSSAITIAIVDDAYDSTHVDLGTGTSKMVAGYDAFSGASNTFPVPATGEPHGTATTGLAAATGNNGTGVSGVCQQCRIMPIRIFTTESAASNAQIANGINYAWQHGADIISNSWGGGEVSTALTNAINAALTSGRGGKGTVVVFAAGNTSGAPVAYPGSLTQVITVSASNLCDQRKTPFSTACNYFDAGWGPNSGPQIDVSAPGVGLYTTDIMGALGYNGTNYRGNFGGTSGATPIVSGTAGLMLSINPNLTAVQVQQILKNNADDIETPGFDNGTGWGRINANRAVSASTASLSIQLTLQARSAAPSPQRITTVHVQVRPASGGTAILNANYTSDNMGRITLWNLPSGSYNVWIKGTHTLARVHSVTLAIGGNSLTTSVLLEGDGNDDNTIALADFSMLSGAFGASTGQTAFNAQVDLNDDDMITIADFSLLSANFGQSGVP